MLNVTWSGSTETIVVSGAAPSPPVTRLPLVTRILPTRPEIGASTVA